MQRLQQNKKFLLKNIQNLTIPNVKNLSNTKNSKFSVKNKLVKKHKNSKTSIFYTNAVFGLNKRISRNSVNFGNLTKKLVNSYKGRKAVFPCKLRKFNFAKKNNFRNKKTIFKNKKICITFQILD